MFSADVFSSLRSIYEGTRAVLARFTSKNFSYTQRGSTHFRMKNSHPDMHISFHTPFHLNPFPSTSPSSAKKSLQFRKLSSSHQPFSPAWTSPAKKPCGNKPTIWVAGKSRRFGFPWQAELQPASTGVSYGGYAKVGIGQDGMVPFFFLRNLMSR